MDLQNLFFKRVGTYYTMHCLSILKKILPDCPHLSLKIPGAVAISCPRCCPKTWPPSGRHWDILLPKINKKSQHKNIRTVAVASWLHYSVLLSQSNHAGQKAYLSLNSQSVTPTFYSTGSFKTNTQFTLNSNRFFFQRLFSEQNHFLHETCMTKMQKKVFF